MQPVACEWTQAVVTATVLVYLPLSTGFRHANPISDCLPVRIVLRFKLPAAGVKGLAASLGREWMQQKLTVARIAGGDQLRDTVEVEFGLLFGPCRAPGHQFLKMESRLILRVAGVTPGVLAPLLEKDGLNFALINLKVEGR